MTAGRWTCVSFQFSIWDAEQIRDLYAARPGYHFQFSIWDARNKAAPVWNAYMRLSILYLRCAATVAVYEYAADDSLLSILYLRCGAKTGRPWCLRRHLYAFQFSIWDARPGRRGRARQGPDLSILYLRCCSNRAHTRWSLLVLSILYLRCACCFGNSPSLRFNSSFNSLFEMRRRTPRIRRRFLRCAFNSLFEMLLEEADYESLGEIELSILYLRCQRRSHFVWAHKHST